VVKLDPRVRVEPLQSAIPTLPGTAIGPFLNQPLVVEAAGWTRALDRRDSESRVIVGVGDTAYADRIGPAMRLTGRSSARAGGDRSGPGEVLATRRIRGDARVRRFGIPTTLEITRARQEINRGDRLMPARETSFPAYIPRAPDKPITRRDRFGRRRRLGAWAIPDRLAEPVAHATACRSATCWRATTAASSSTPPAARAASSTVSSELRALRDQAGDRGARSARHRPPPDGTVGSPPAAPR
jgi:hypothetical protein